MVQVVKNSPAMQETWVQSLGWEDPQEECMATHSSILAWRTPQTEEHSRLQSIGSQSQTRLKQLSTQRSSLFQRISRFTEQWAIVYSLHILPNTVKTFFSPMNASCHSQQDGECKECWTGWQRAL